MGSQVLGLLCAFCAGFLYSAGSAYLRERRLRIRACKHATLVGLIWSLILMPVGLFLGLLETRIVYGVVGLTVPVLIGYHIYRMVRAR